MNIVVFSRTQNTLVLQFQFILSKILPFENCQSNHKYRKGGGQNPLSGHIGLVVNQMGVFRQDHFCFSSPIFIYPLITIRGLKNIKNVLGREAKSQINGTPTLWEDTVSICIPLPSAKTNKQTNKRTIRSQNQKHYKLNDTVL